MVNVKKNDTVNNFSDTFSKLVHEMCFHKVTLNNQITAHYTFHFM